MRAETRQCRVASWLAGWAALLAGLTAAPVARAAAPWEGGPFEADPKALVKAAAEAAAAETAPVLVLLDERRAEVDAEGRLTEVTRLVYRINAEAALEWWSGVDEEWAPWRQARPDVRARVVTPEGVTHLLDPKLLVEAPASERDPALYGDRRKLRAPLPAMSVGAVVEELHTVRDTQPQPAGGVSWRAFIGSGWPVRLQRIVITVPTAAPTRLEVIGLGDVVPEKRAAGDRTVYTLEIRDPKVWKDIETGLPPEVPPLPMLALSTVPSWNAVAKAYAAIVERQLAGADLVATARKMAGSARGREQVIRTLTDALHASIRYTGVHFGDASIVPWTPKEVLKRQFGDCKDQAMLLVGLLRAAGIQAHVALLRTGPGLDIDSRLPGLEAFDHAIVHVPGTPEIWVDPTARYTRAGSLPAPDLGRQALIAAPTTTGLVTTPASTAEENGTLAVREVFLAKKGEGRIVETIEAWGVPESDLRAWFAGLKRETRDERLKEYVRSEFGAKELGAVTVGETTDLSKPFRYSMEALKCARASTADAVAAVTMPVGVLLHHIPAELWKPEAEDGEEPAPRRGEFQFPYPFVKEMRYRITPPPGFAPQPLPAPEQRTIGTLRLSHEATADAAGTVTVSFRLESGKTRLGPAEVESVRTELARLAESNALQVWFEQVGEAHLAAGRVREALEEFGKLVRAFPKEAIHHSQMARALVAAGMGEEARTEARRATQVEPSSAAAFAVLGWVLQHDLIGRRFKPGWDRPGALAAYRKAAELDPKDAAIRADLAILLEHDEQGQRYQNGPDLNAAIAEYRYIRNELKEKKFDTNLLFALMWAQRYAELEELAKEGKPGAETNAWLVLVRTARDGVPDGIAEAQRRFPAAPERRQALVTTADRLVRLRLYEDAAALLDEAAKGSPDAAALRARAEVLRKLHRYDEMDLSGEDAVAVFRRFVVAWMESGPGGEKVLQLFPREVVAMLEADKELEKEFLGSVQGAALAGLASGLPRLVVIDSSLAAFELVVDGKDQPIQRVRAQVAVGDRPMRTELYIARRPEGLKVLATDDDFSFLGVEILRLVEAGQLEPARQACEWARESLTLRSGDDQLSGPLFPRVWSKGDPADAARLRLAGAVLANSSSLARTMLPALEAACQEAAGDSLRLACDLALAQARGTARKYDLQLEVAQRLLEAYPDSDTALSLVVRAAQGAGKWDVAERAARGRLERTPGDPAGLRMLADTLAATGDYAGAVRELQKLVDDGKESAGDYNQLAWYALFLGKLDDATVTAAQRAVERSRGGAYGSIHTQAAVFAELGHTTEAYQTILKGISMKEEEVPESADWYVFGRLAEWYGLPEAAARCYARVTLEPFEPEAVSTYRLAQRRLEALGKGRGAKRTR
ncbi:MAG TPA: DUF3857 domain-containing protein [Thermoanaerobaculaceae bacterium]|nr:DUF3857 domain-containing protein [Thermoanaerobaculaceae bacterium]HRS17813.1 DUF3857 domain-containing protein [Thermoanaerobaculaceae bacterium]